MSQPAQAVEHTSAKQYCSRFSTLRRFDRHEIQGYKAKTQGVANMFGVRLTLINHEDNGSKGYRLKTITPVKELP